MDSVRPSALGTDAVVGTHRPVAPWLSRGANSGDPGEQTASSTQRRTVRVVAGGPVLVQGAGPHRDAWWQHGGFGPASGPGTPEMLGPSGAPVWCPRRPRAVPSRTTCGPKTVPKQAAVPYPGSVWPATQASTWVQVRSSQGPN